MQTLLQSETIRYLTFNRICARIAAFWNESGTSFCGAACDILDTPPTDGKPDTPPRELETLPAKLAIDPTERIMYGDS